MLKVLRLVFMVVIVLIAVLAPALVQPEWADDLRSQTWYATILDDHPRHTDAELTQLSILLKRRIHKKERLIDKLIDGRITLFEAATLFRRWNKEHPQMAHAPFDCKISEEEQVCCQVIQWARNHLWQRYPYRADELSRRLEDELRRHKADHGRVVLPEVVEQEECEE